MRLETNALVDYGIKNEGSLARVHVCFQVRQMYSFSTAAAIGAMEGCKKRLAFQEGIVTAEGHLVRPRDIPGCRQTAIPDVLMEHDPGTNGELGNKGSAAMAVVIRAIRWGILPLPLVCKEIVSIREQRNGGDIRFETGVVQVKCDYRGGPKTLGGTGHLYIQVAESNPFHIF